MVESNPGSAPARRPPFPGWKKIMIAAGAVLVLVGLVLRFAAAGTGGPGARRVPTAADPAPAGSTGAAPAGAPRGSQGFVAPGSRSAPLGQPGGSGPPAG